MPDTTPAYVGFDLETTGLNPHTHHILEIGCVLFNARLHPLTHRSWITTTATQLDQLTIDDVALTMHKTSGLLHDIRGQHTPGAPGLDAAEEQIVTFLENEQALGLPMLGSSITFDRTFIAHHMPILAEAFHYRSLDATSVMLALRTVSADIETDPTLTAQVSAVRRLMATQLGASFPMRKHRVIYDILTSAAVAHVAITAAGKGS